MTYERAIVKFNGGRGALLRNGCGSIFTTGTDHVDCEYYCVECTQDIVDGKVPGKRVVAGPEAFPDSVIERLQIIIDDKEQDE